MDALMAFIYSVLAIGIGVIIGECVYRLTVGFMPNPEPKFNDSDADSEDDLLSSNC